MEMDSRIAEQALAGHPADELFRLLVTTVSDSAIFLLDPAGHVVSWNAGAERIKGYAAAEIVGRHLEARSYEQRTRLVHRALTWSGTSAPREETPSND